MWRFALPIRATRERAWPRGDCELAPQAFRLDDRASVIGTVLYELLLQPENCPVEAIALFDAETGEQVYP